MRQMPSGHSHDKYENYEWPGGFTRFGDGETCARVRVEKQLSPKAMAAAGVHSQKQKTKIRR